MPFRTKCASLLTIVFALFLAAFAHRFYTTNKASRLAPEIDAFANDDMKGSASVHRFDGILLARIEKRKEITLQLAAGRMSLFEAAAKFKRLNREPNPSPHRMENFFPGASDNERLCRQVIEWLRHQPMPSKQREQALAQAEADLRDHLACHGGQVILPED
jgi:hypothetical protein